VDLSVVREDGDSLEQVLDEHSLLGCRGGFPDLVYVDRGEQGGDGVKPLRDLVPLLLFGFDPVLLLAERCDLGTESSVFVCEGVLADLVCVVQIEELSPLALKCSESRLAVGSSLTRGAPMAEQFLTDGGL
jgi:hypothetical protein